MRTFSIRPEKSDFKKENEEIIPNWNKADDKGIIHVPDELDGVFNKVGMQIRFMTISGKNEIQTIADIVHGCQKFFKEIYSKSNK